MVFAPPSGARDRRASSGARGPTTSASRSSASSFGATRAAAGADRRRRHGSDRAGRRPGADPRARRRPSGRLAAVRARVRGRSDVRRALTAVTAGAGEIAMGAAEVVLAGGIEHMGHHPMGEDVDFNPRFVAERLVDPSAVTMGATAENLHDRFPQLTKQDADAFAVRSQQRAAAAWENGVMRETVVPMSVFTDQGWQLAGRDEFLRPDTSLEGLADLPTPFRAGRARDGRQLRGAHRRRRGLPARLRGGGARARPAAADAPRLLCVRRSRAGADGARPRARDAQGARAGRPEPRRHRSLRAERAVRGAGPHLVRGARARPRGRAAEPVRRRDRLRAPARGHRRTAARAARLRPGRAARGALRAAALCVGMGMGAALVWESLAA